jgi:hypothetical protein
MIIVLIPAIICGFFSSICACKSDRIKKLAYLSGALVNAN